MQSPQSTVIRQYGNSPALTQLVQNMNDYFDPSANLGNFFTQIWNIDTAQGYGLIIWGRIVNVGNTIQVTNPDYFGFSQAGLDGFSQGPFYSGEATTATFVLSDDAYRQVILAKALFNICDGSIPAINQILLNLFAGRGNCYVQETGPLMMAYVFTFALTPVEYAIVTQLGILPRPSGVATSVMVL